MPDITVLIPAIPELPVADEIRVTISVLLKNAGIEGEIRFLPLPITSLNDPEDGGRKRSVKWLYSALSGETAEIIIVLSPQYFPYVQKIPTIVQDLSTGPYDLITMSGSGTGVLRAGTKKHHRTAQLNRCLARFLFPQISDPICGFFAVKKAVIRNAELNPEASCPLLEILAKGDWRSPHETLLSDPYPDIIQDKNKQESFFRIFLQLFSVTIYSILHRESAGWREIQKVIKFGIVGASGVIVNMGVLFALTEFFQIYYLFSSFIAIELSIITNFFLNDFWTFRKDKAGKIIRRLHRFISYNIVCVGNVLINISALYIFTELLGINYLISNFIGIMIAFIWSFGINRKITWGD
jgi:dolichol-phosphate mannosyltransferase